MSKYDYSRALINSQEVFGEQSCTVGCMGDISIIFHSDGAVEKDGQLTLSDIRLLSQKEITFQHSVNGVRTFPVDCTMSGSISHLGENVFEIKLNIVN